MNRSVALVGALVLATSCGGGSEGRNPDGGPDAADAGGAGGTSGIDAGDGAGGSYGTGGSATAGSGGAGVGGTGGSSPGTGGSSPGIGGNAGTTGAGGAPPRNQLAVLVGQLGGVGCGDGVGPTARLGMPSGIVRGSDGQLYVADWSCGTIRRFDPATGAVTTVAGMPDRSGSADGRGNAARLRSPEGLAADDSGNLFLAEGENMTIRKIVLATAEVTTLAGASLMRGSQDGIGAQARFSYPMGIAADGVGNLFVSDARNHHIRKIVIATAQVTTFAGDVMGFSGNVDSVGGAARFTIPSQLAADGAGHLYVADAGNNAIRHIDLVTAQVTTIAATNVGSGGAGGAGAVVPFSGPQGVNLDGNGRLFIADTRNEMVRTLNTATGQISNVAGASNVPDYRDYRDGVGTAARFDTPTHIFRDAPGHAYVSDEANAVVRAIDVTTGTVTTVAGTGARYGYQDGLGGAAALSYIPFIYSDGQANLYVTDTFKHTVRKIVVATGEMTTIAGMPSMPGSSDGRGDAARFNNPQGISGDGAGNLYVADSGIHTIRRIALSTGEVTTIAGVAYLRGTADGTGTAARFDTPTGIACDGVNLYITDQTGSVVRQMALATLAVTTLAGAPNMYGNVDGMGDGARFQRARAVVHDGTGSLYIADYANNSVRKLVLATRQVTTYARGSLANPGLADGPLATANFYNPYDLAIDGSGHLYVADYYNLRIRRIDLATQTVSTVVGTATTGSGVILGPLSTARLNYPVALAVLPGGAGVVLACERALLTAWF